MNNAKLGALVLLLLFLLSPSALVLAQYGHEPKINVLDSNGYFFFQDWGIKAIIQGTPGANCTIQTNIFLGNPQPGAAVPDGISLTLFRAIDINMNANQFTNVSITVNYTATDLQDIQPPYVVYEYDPITNSYEKLSSAIVTGDVSESTITFTSASLTSLFAVGGASAATIAVAEGEIILWLILVGVIIAVVVALLIVIRFKRFPSNPKMK